MQRIQWTAFVTAFAIAIMAGSQVPAAAADKDIEAAIRAGTQAWIKAFNANDVEAVVAAYAENAVVMPPGVPVAKGRTAIRQFLQTEMGAMKEAGVTLSLGSMHDAGVSGNLAWDSGDYVVKDKSGATIDSGTYLGVHQKIGGKWLLIRDTWNSDRPPASPSK